VKTRYLIEPALANRIDLDASGGLTDEIITILRNHENDIGARDWPRFALDGVEIGDAVACGHVADAAPPLLFCRPQGSEVTPVILHIHGGGFIFSSAREADQANQLYALAHGCAVLSVDYRRAPEHPYPAAIDDCYAALHWLYDNAPELQVDSNRVVVMGESAGASLAAALCHRVRDAGGPKIAAQILVYPMLDDRTSDLEPHHEFVGETVWNRDRNRYAWGSYLNGQEEPFSSHAVPARATDFTALPPASIFVGALDLFLEESLEYGRRLTRAGIPVELHVYRGAYHGFDNIADAKATLAFKNDLSRSLREALFS